MGFDLAHLRFYRWLVQHARNPEFCDEVPEGAELEPLGLDHHHPEIAMAWTAL